MTLLLSPCFASPVFSGFAFSVKRFPDDPGFGFFRCLCCRFLALRPLRPSEYSVLLLDLRRYRLGSSSSGIRRSFRVLSPLKYHLHWFCDPALPLALASAVRFSFSGLPPATV
jgi:hypothetical protein